MSTISQNLRKYRLNCGLTQYQVANVLNINRATYSYYEIGKTEPNLDMLVKIAKLFNVSTADLLYDSNANTFRSEIPLETRQAKKQSIYDLSPIEQNLILQFRIMSNEEKLKLIESITDQK